jgi:hypothetical protein
MTSQPIRSGIAAAAVAGTFALAGCGSDEDQTATAETAAPTTTPAAAMATPEPAAEAAPAAAPAPAALRGRWQRLMRAEDFGASNLLPLGVWKIDVRCCSPATARRAPGASTARRSRAPNGSARAS